MWWMVLAMANPVVPVQGTLADAAGVPVNGSTVVRFNLWTTATGGTEAWTEETTLQLNNGVFTHALGNTTALDLSDWQVDDDLWLSVAWGGNETARVPLGYAARALHANNAARLGGKAPADYTYTAGNGLDLAATTFTVAPSEIYGTLDGRYHALNGYTATAGVKLTGTAFSADTDWLNARYAAVGSGGGGGGATGAGTVAQMVVATSTTTASANVTEFTEVNSSYRVSITPKSSSSIYLIEYDFPLNTAMAVNTVFHMQLVRNIGGTEVPIGVGPANGSRRQATWVGRPFNGYDTNDQGTVHIVARDSGLTAGTTYTYGLKYRRESGGSGTTYFNYSGGDSAVYGFSGMMTMKITEIAQ